MLGQFQGESIERMELTGFTFRFRDKGMLATIGRNRAVAWVDGEEYGPGSG